MMRDDDDKWEGENVREEVSIGPLPINMTPPFWVNIVIVYIVVTNDTVALSK